MFEYSKSYTDFLKGHSPYDDSEVYINLEKVVASSRVTLHKNEYDILATRIDCIENNSYYVKEPFYELLSGLSKLVG